jgi:hypothetical protein
VTHSHSQDIGDHIQFCYSHLNLLQEPGTCQDDGGDVFGSPLGLTWAGLIEPCAWASGSDKMLSELSRGRSTAHQMLTLAAATSETEERHDGLDGLKRYVDRRRRISFDAKTEFGCADVTT